MASLFFDGDLRRVYEVPEPPFSFTVDGNGYRIYTPDNIPGAATEVFVDTTVLWSRWVDYHNVNKWATLALGRAGGAFRFTDQDGNDIFATFDLRWTNDWLLVPANYDHKFTVLGNLFPNLAGVNAGEDFDTTRLSTFGVSPRIQFADSLQRVVVSTTGGIGDSDKDDVATRTRDLLLSTEVQAAGPAGTVRTHTPTL